MTPLISLELHRLKYRREHTTPLLTEILNTLILAPARFQVTYHELLVGKPL